MRKTSISASIADALLQTITQTDAYFEMDNQKTARMIDNEQYVAELIERLQSSGLTQKQRMLLNALVDAQVSVMGDIESRAILFGMQAYNAFQEMIHNPLEALMANDTHSKSSREVYPVKDCG